MGVPRTLPAVTVPSASSPVPAVSGTPLTPASVTFKSGICTITMGTSANAMPTNGYNGPNGFPSSNAVGAQFDIHGSDAGSGGPAGGQQVTLWNFSTTYAAQLNGKVVSVIANPSTNSFSFYFAFTGTTGFTEANTTGQTAACPFEHYRTVRIEVDQANGTDIVYVGDLNVSSSQYVAALSLQGQLAAEISSENVPGDRIWMVATNSSATDKVHTSLIY
jgi:hypothetical protein